MPVYIRKNTKFTPDSLQNFNPDEDDLEDFIQDPDQFKDKLPQPYRLLDKILTNIVEDAWDVIVQRESERNAEASKIRPPMYTTDIQIEVHGPTKSLCSSPTGDYVFLGMPDGLVAINATANETLDEWKDEKMDIVNVQAYTVDAAHHLICTIDDIGIGRLFLFSEDNLYLMHTFNETWEGVTSADFKNRSPPQQTSYMMGSSRKEKPIITKCESSSNGDVIGVCYQNTQTHENWLEFYRVNKESLFKELDNANAKFTKKPEAQMEGVDEVTAEGGGEDVPSSEVGTAREDASEDRTDEVEGGEGGDKKESPNSQKSSDKKSVKFSAPTLILKVKPPQPIQGANFTTPIAAQKAADETGDVLGTGTKHMLSTFHLELKKAVFEHNYEHMLPYMPKEDKQAAIKEPNFHFLYPGRILPQGLEQQALQGQPTSVAIWWEGQYQVLTYSLIKPVAKEVEHKPDLVWPFSSSIIYSTVTPDCSIMALALANNNIVVWDLMLGTVRRIVHVTDASQVFKLMFLDPSLYENDNSTFNASKPYKIATNCYLLSIFHDGQLYKITCGLNDTTPPEKLSSSLKIWENYTVVEPLAGLPELVVTCRKNGQVFIEDVSNGNILLEIHCPSPFSVFTPWQPVFAIGGKGGVLYVKGRTAFAESMASGYEGQKDTTQEANIESLFVFKLRSYRTLDAYRRKKRNDQNSYTVHPTVEHRTHALLKDRISQQGTRQTRMQQRWTQLKEELELIKDLRDRSSKKSAPRSAFMSVGF